MRALVCAPNVIECVIFRRLFVFNSSAFKENDNLDYIGVVVSGRERSSVTDRPPYPRQIAVFPRLK